MCQMDTAHYLPSQYIIVESYSCQPSNFICKECLTGSFMKLEFFLYRINNLCPSVFQLSPSRTKLSILDPGAEKVTNIKVIP